MFDRVINTSLRARVRVCLYVNLTLSENRNIIDAPIGDLVHKNIVFIFYENPCLDFNTRKQVFYDENGRKQK